MKKDPYAPLRDQMNQPPEYWRSIAHKEGDATLAAQLDVEFPHGLAPVSGVSRRDALKIGGAALGMGALAGCDKLPIRRPVEEILPFVKQPDGVVPGLRMYYATAMQRSEGAIGLIVEANQGRPTKIEGNPNHPSSLGASDIWAQAEVLRLYDPERARTPMQGSQASTWEKFDAMVKETTNRLGGAQGKGLALLLEGEVGPTGEKQLAALKAKWPEAKIYRWDPTAADHAAIGTQIAFGPGTRAQIDLEKAQIIFSLESNFLVAGPDHLKLARQFGKSRAVHTREDAAKMHRLYAAEAAFSATGTNADHRVRIASGQGVDVLKALAKALGGLGLTLGELDAAVVPGALPENVTDFVNKLAKDLYAHRGSAAIMVGENQSAPVHALAHALNAGLNAPVSMMSTGTAARTSMFAQLNELVQGLNAGQIDTLVMFDVNPVYTAPGALKFGEALAKAKTSIHFGVLPEETGLKATWHAPLAHFLESWGDTRAFDGTVSLVQPLIQPIFSARPMVSVLAMLLGETETHDRKLIEGTWHATGAALADNKAWRRALHDGVIPNTAWAKGAGTLNLSAVAAAVGPLKGAVPAKDTLEIIAFHGHQLDGRLTNVAWTMELPDTMSKLTWDNALLMSPQLAKELNIESAVRKNTYQADVVKLEVGGRSISGPVFVMPGLAPYSVVINKGYGRAIGEVSKGIGIDVQPLLDGEVNVVQGVKASKTGAVVELCSTQDHFSMPGNPLRELTFAAMTAEPKGAVERTLGLNGRPHFMSGTAAEYQKDGAEFARKADMPENLVQLGTPKNRPTKPIQMTAEVIYEGQQWGMVIDLSSCIGCNICSIACVAENNIPSVGREQVMLGREMHWIRIDRYFSGDIENPHAIHQPVACQHCENAPCEPVCPVSATVHDEEGLNSMAYNRCIGTRYCANNCPYKVRRFNYLDFTHTGDVYVEPYWKERMKTLKLQRNPDVTVRYRGVMEKCSYCTQRVEEAKIAAKREGEDRKKLPDGAVTPACAQACPTQAITFGNINDEKSRVFALKKSERNYELLQELNVRPRTSYLARVRNENEELA